MFIDIHTHIFPDKVAAKAIPKLAGVIHLEPSMDGTYEGLKKNMETSGVDLSIVLPTVTAPQQFDSIIRFADSINNSFREDPSRGIFSLAGIHPASESWEEQLKLIKSLGFPGLKVHPDYQDAMFNDIRYKRILAKASELGLFVLTHTGNDPYSPDVVHCTVPMIEEVLDDVAPTKLVLAHMGNNEYYDDVEERLLGRDVYLDTAYSIANVPSERVRRMIQRHGADKVLFGSDAPWTTPAEDVKILSNMGLTPEEFELVSHKNAEKLLEFSL